MTAPSTTPSATPSTKPTMVVASVCTMCGHRIGNFWNSVATICDGRGSIRSDMPVIRQNSSQATKNNTISPADQAFCLISTSDMVRRSLLRGAAARIDDEGTQLLIERRRSPARRSSRRCAAGRSSTRRSSRMRPGRALITQMRLAEEAGLAQIVGHQQHGRLVASSRGPGGSPTAPRG